MAIQKAMAWRSLSARIRKPDVYRGTKMEQDSECREAGGFLLFSSLDDVTIAWLKPEGWSTAFFSN
jgi:hypothetical protein